jgi:hypothetical protein
LAERLPDCPVCHTNARIFKFSQVYIASITDTSNRSIADQRLLAEVFRESDDPTHRQAILSLFSPPPARATLHRSIHPDLVVFLLGLTVFAFFSITFLNQSTLFPFAISGLLVLICLYLIFRRKILIRLNISSQSEKAKPLEFEEMTRRWTRLYYCAKDNCVFDPTKGDWAEIEDPYHYLGET